MNEIVIYKNKVQQFSIPVPVGTSSADIEALSKLVKKVDSLLAVLGSPFEIVVMETAILGKDTFQIPGEVRRG